ncbi:hypothetical protein [Streptomyces rhizosphaericus]
MAVYKALSGWGPGRRARSVPSLDPGVEEPMIAALGSPAGPPGVR